MKRWNFLEDADDAIVVLNDDGKIIFSNKFFDDLFGYDEDHLEGKYIHEFMPEFSGVANQDILYGIGIKKDGTEFKLKINLTKLSLKRKTVYLGIASATEHDQLSHMEQVLDSLTKTLQKASHIIKLPLQNN